MATTVPLRVQHKRMTKAQWASSNVVLLAGEIGVESDTGFLKVGNGTSRFSALSYLVGPAGPAGPAGSTGPMGQRGPIGYTGAKGDKGDPLRFTDLTNEQKAELKGQWKYTTTIGNTTATEYTVTHSLGTTDVVVQTWMENELVLVDTIVLSATQIKLVFGSAPGTNTIKVVVLG